MVIFGGSWLHRRTGFNQPRIPLFSLHFGPGAVAGASHNYAPRHNKVVGSRIAVFL
jgi:hypothetical protein